MSVARGAFNAVVLEALVFFALWALWVWVARS